MTSFGFFVAAGGVLAILWLRLNHRNLGLTENEFWAAMWLMLLAGIVGAKALFVILGWKHYASGELQLVGSFGTGFVFFGGLAAGVLAGGVIAIIKRVNFLRGADYFAVALPLGHAIGRIGCFFKGCCGGHPPHPVQLYESAGLTGIAALGMVLLRRIQAGKLPHGAAFCGYLCLYGILRFILDPLRADGRTERFWGLSHQQGLAMGMMLSGVSLVWFLRQKARSPN